MRHLPDSMLVQGHVFTQICAARRFVPPLLVSVGAHAASAVVTSFRVLCCG
jgi:hypothetical protein